MLITLAKSCIESEHIKTQKPCQDFSAAMTDKKKRYAYAIVADGHGGEKYFRSDKGSEIAVRCSVEIVNGILKSLFPYIKRKEKDFVEKNLKLLTSKIPHLWREKVACHYAENPLTEAEEIFCEEHKISLPLENDDVPSIYGTTLLFAAYFEQEEFWFALQIGDGKCVLIKDDGKTDFPVPEDEKLGFGVTTSLSGKNATQDFRFAFAFEKIAGIAVMSDGMADSFTPEKLPDFILDIRGNALSNAEQTETELTNFLPKLSEQGSGDDISIAGVFVKGEG